MHVFVYFAVIYGANPRERTIKTRTPKKTMGVIIYDYRGLFLFLSINLPPPSNNRLLRIIYERKYVFYIITYEKLNFALQIAGNSDVIVGDLFRR